MSRTGTTPENRPLFDRSQPKGIVFYPVYRVVEVAQIMGIGPDKVRSLCRGGYFGEVIRIENQRMRPHKRNHTTFLIPYQPLFNVLPETDIQVVA